MKTDHKVKGLRKYLMIILSLSAVGLTFFFSNLKYKKTLKYGSHKIKYDQYIKGEKYLYAGHYLHNEDLEDQAYMILANRLLDDYLNNPDSLLMEDLLRIANKHNLKRGLKINSLDSLLTHREFILDTLILIY